jgi:hypothetical protein
MSYNDGKAPGDDDGPDISWWRIGFFAAVGLALVAGIFYLYVLAVSGAKPG